MKKKLFLFVAIASFLSSVAQQKTESTDKSAPKSEKASESNLVFNPDKSVINSNEINF